MNTTRPCSAEPGEKLRHQQQGTITGMNSFQNLYSNFLFSHYEAEVGIEFYIENTAVQTDIWVAKCQKCGAFSSVMLSNSHPVEQ